MRFLPAAVVGVSAFAFQGTNAHALLAGQAVGAEVEKPTGVWSRKQRYWVVPRAHALLHQAVVAMKSRVTMQADLSRASLAFFWDHQVSGKVLFPGAGYFEMAAATDVELHVIVLSGVSITEMEYHTNIL